MAFCTNCGNKIEEGEKFCKHCGQKVNFPEAETTVSPEPSQSATPEVDAAPQENEVTPAAPQSPAQPQVNPTQPTSPQPSVPPQPQSSPRISKGASPQVEPGAPIYGIPNPETKATKGNPMITRGIGIGIAVLLVIVFVFALGGKGKKKETNTPVSAAPNATEKTGASENATTGKTDEQAEPTALQKQWNGTWYGVLHIVEATGDFKNDALFSYDSYMVVDVDASGKGQFAVYLSEVEDAFAKGTCEVKETGFYATDGTVAGGEKLDPYNWMLLPSRNDPEQFTMSDTIQDGTNTIEYVLNFKPWGTSWQNEIDRDGLLPPSVQVYEISIQYHEQPPIGFAPIDYK